MSRMKDFTPANPTGATPGMEPVVRLDVLRAGVDNIAPAPAPTAPTSSPLGTSASTPPALINKNIRLPADLVDFIDYVYTKEQRMRKQDAYTQALEQFFRPLMQAKSAS